MDIETLMADCEASRASADHATGLGQARSEAELQRLRAEALYQAKREGRNRVVVAGG